MIEKGQQKPDLKRKWDKKVLGKISEKVKKYTYSKEIPTTPKKF